MSSLPELPEVLYILRSVENRYFSLGIQLGIDIEELNTIECNHSDVKRRFTETISYWKKNTRSTECSWSTLAKAVERIGGEDNLAKKLRGLNVSDPAVKPQMLHHPTERADEGYLSVQSDLTESMPQKSDARGSEDESGYSSKSDSVQSGDSSGSEAECFELAPGCGCTGKKPCSLYTSCAGRCPNPTHKGVPGILRKKAKDATQSEIPLEDEHDFEDHEKSTKGLRKSFGNLVCKTCRSFKESKVTIQEFTLYLQCTFPVMKTRTEELNRATCYEEVFKIINQTSSWFNYEIIADTIEQFNNSAAKKYLEKYEEHFKEYTKQRLPKGMKHIEIGDGVKRGGKQLVIKIDREWEEVTFSDLDKLRGTFAFILGVKRKDLYLADVKEGCIMMTFRITEELAGRLFPSRSYLTSAQVKSLKEEGVRSLVCGKWSWRVAVRTREHNTSEKVSKVHKKQNKRNQRVFDPSILMLLCLLATAFAFLLIFGLTVVCAPSNPSSSPQILLESPCISNGTRLYCSSSSTGGHYDVRSARKRLHYKSQHWSVQGPYFYDQGISACIVSKMHRFVSCFSSNSSNPTKLPGIADSNEHMPRLQNGENATTIQLWSWIRTDVKFIVGTPGIGKTTLSGQKSWKMLKLLPSTNINFSVVEGAPGSGKSTSWQMIKLPRSTDIKFYAIEGGTGTGCGKSILSGRKSCEKSLNYLLYISIQNTDSGKMRLHMRRKLYKEVTCSLTLNLVTFGSAYEDNSLKHKSQKILNYTCFNVSTSLHEHCCDLQSYSVLDRKFQELLRTIRWVINQLRNCYNGDHNELDQDLETLLQEKEQSESQLGLIRKNAYVRNEQLQILRPLEGIYTCGQVQVYFHGLNVKNQSNHLEAGSTTAFCTDLPNVVCLPTTGDSGLGDKWPTMKSVSPLLVQESSGYEIRHLTPLTLLGLIQHNSTCIKHPPNKS